MQTIGQYGVDNIGRPMETMIVMFFLVFAIEQPTRKRAYFLCHINPLSETVFYVYRILVQKSQNIPFL